MICPKCNYDNKDSIKCEKCGEQLIYYNIESHRGFLSGIGATIGGIGFLIFLYFFMYKKTTTITKIVGIPFLICGIALLLYGIMMLHRKVFKKNSEEDLINGNLDKVENGEKKIEKFGNFIMDIYLIGFLLFWFGFLIVYDVLTIKSWNDGGKPMFFQSLIFWGVGIFMVIAKFKKKK